MSSYLHFCNNIEHYPVVAWFTSSILVSLMIWLCHYVSVFLTVGSMVMINLRVLGIAGKRQSLTQVADIYGPWMWIGLTVLVVTGILMLAGDSALYCTNGVFGINLLVTALAAATGAVVKKSASSWTVPRVLQLLRKCSRWSLCSCGSEQSCRPWKFRRVPMSRRNLRLRFQISKQILSVPCCWIEDTNAPMAGRFRECAAE